MILLAYLSAIITIGFGLLCYFAPAKSLDLIHLQTKPDRPEAVAESRGTIAGFYLGVGLLCIIMPSPTAFLALSLGWGFTAFGRLSSILLDNGRTRFNLFSVCFEALLALLPLPVGLFALMA